MSIPLRTLSRCATAALLLLSLSAGAHQLRDPIERLPLAAQANAAAERLTGVVHRVVVDDRTAGIAIPVYSLATDDGRTLRLREVASPLDDGARVEVVGRRNGKALFVDTARALSGPTAPIRKSASRRSVTGKLALLHVDYFDEERSAFLFEVHDADGRTTPLAMDLAPESLQSGMQVTATGEPALDGDALVPDTITITALPPAGTARALEKAVKTNNVLVILMRFTDSPGTPFTQAQVQAVVGGGPGSGSVAEYFKEVSYGQQLIAPTVTPWLPTGAATPTGCNWSQMGTLGRNAAAAAGYNLAAYQNVVYVFPNVPACGWVGLGYIGASGVWINGRNATSAYGHELGHNFGLLHAGSVRCSGGSIGGTCSVSEYGDPFDIMGNQSAMHFSAPQKLDLGWIAPGTVATHSTGSGTYVLNPVESGGGSLYAVKIPAFTNRTYWLEYRQPLGFDGGLAGYPNNGVQVRVASPFETLCPGCDAWSNDTELLDMNPATSTFTDAALTVGRTFTDATYGVSIAVLAASANGVTVQVTAPGAATGTRAAVGLATSANPAPSSAPLTITATVTGNVPTGTVSFTASGSPVAGCTAVALAGAGNTRTASCTATLAAGTFAIVAAYSGDANNTVAASAPLTETVSALRMNHALASNGSVATGSSTYTASYVAAGAIDGDRKGRNWGGNGGWADGTPGAFPDSLQVAFASSRWVDEIDLVTAQDGRTMPVEPTEAMTFSAWGVTAFDLEYWTGSAWRPIPGGSISGNNKVWRKVTFPAVYTSKVRVVVKGSADGYSRVVELEAWGPAVGQTNVALAANGAIASGSSAFSASYVAAGANNGDRKGTNWGGNGGWADASPGAFPDWLEIAFNASKWVSEIDVFTAQDGRTMPVEPTEGMTFSAWGVTAFVLQYWNGSAWQAIPGGSVTGNNKVWRKVSFAPILTSKIRAVVQGSGDGYSRIVELEAWGQ